MGGGIQKVCPLTSFPNLTMTTTVALANDYGVNLPIIASSSQHKVPVFRAGRSMHSGPALRTVSLLKSTVQNLVPLDLATMFQGSEVPSRQHLLGEVQ